MPSFISRKEVLKKRGFNIIGKVIRLLSSLYPSTHIKEVPLRERFAKPRDATSLFSLRD